MEDSSTVKRMNTDSYNFVIIDQMDNAMCGDATIRNEVTSKFMFLVECRLIGGGREGDGASEGGS